MGRQIFLNLNLNLNLNLSAEGAGPDNIVSVGNIVCVVRWDHTEAFKLEAMSGSER